MNRNSRRDGKKFEDNFKTILHTSAKMPQVYVPKTVLMRDEAVLCARAKLFRA